MLIKVFANKFVHFTNNRMNVGAKELMRSCVDGVLATLTWFSLVLRTKVS